MDDQRLIIATEDEDLIARDVLYHRSCFRNKTRIAPQTRYEACLKQDAKRAGYNDSYETAFEELAASLELNIIKNGVVLHLSPICDEFRILLRKRGVPSSSIVVKGYQ